MLTIVRRNGVAEPDRADAIQDIFVEVFSHLDRYDPEHGKFKYWVRSVAVHRLLKRRRADRRHARIPLEQIAPDDFTARADNGELKARLAVPLTPWIAVKTRFRNDRYWQDQPLPTAPVSQRPASLYGTVGVS